MKHTSSLVNVDHFPSSLELYAIDTAGVGRLFVIFEPLYDIPQYMQYCTDFLTYYYCIITAFPIYSIFLTNYRMGGNVSFKAVPVVIRLERITISSGQSSLTHLVYICIYICAH